MFTPVTPELAAELLKGLGFGDGLIKKAALTLAELAEPQFTGGYFTLEEKEGGTGLKGTSLILTGKDIKNRLSGCDECYMFALTLGRRVDAFIERSGVSGLLEGYAVDTLAGYYADMLAEEIQAEVGKKAAEKGRFVTERFSPGYGDLPLQSQEGILTALGADKILKIVLTEGGMMTPFKSITAIMGISDVPSGQKPERCANCPKKNLCKGAVCGD